MPGEAEIPFEEAVGSVSTPAPTAAVREPAEGEISFAEAMGPAPVSGPSFTDKLSQGYQLFKQTTAKRTEMGEAMRRQAFTNVVGEIDETPGEGFAARAGKAALRGIRALVTSPVKSAVGGAKAITGGVISMAEQIPAGIRGLGRLGGEALIRETVGRIPASAATAPITGAISRAAEAQPLQGAVSEIEASLEETGKMREVASQITNINLAAESEQDKAMEGLLMLMPEGIVAAGDSVYEKTGSALAGAGTQGLLTLLTFKPGIAGKVVEASVRGVKSKELFNTTFDALAVSEPDAAQAVIEHIEQTAPKTAQKMRMRFDQAKNKWEPTELGKEVVKQQLEAAKEITPEAAGVGLSEAAAETPKVETKPTAKPAEAKPEMIIDEDAGQFEIKSPAGEFLAQENRQYLQVKRADVVEAERGKGHAQKAMEMLADEAEKRGLTLASDFSVSKDAQRVYEALGKKGFEVKENPNTVNSETGSKVSNDIRVPVYEVTRKEPPPALSDPRLTSAVRVGEAGDAGAHYAVAGGSTYFNPDAPGAKYYDLSSLRIADMDAQAVAERIIDKTLELEKAAKDSNPEVVARLEELRKDPYAIGYVDNEELGLHRGAKELGYDGMLLWESDDIGGASTINAWKKAKEISREEFDRAQGREEPTADLPPPVDTAKAEQIFVSGPTLSSLPGGKFIQGKMAAWWDEIIRNINPEALGQKAKQAAAILANKIAETMNKDAANHGMAAERIAFWDKLSPAETRDFISRFEKGQKQINAVLQKLDKFLRDRADEIFKQDQSNGIKYDPIDNYLYHIFENGDALAKHFEAKYGKKWGDPKFMKARHFDLYEEAIKAGFKPKFTNPEEILLARQHASDMAQMQVELLKDLESYGLAQEKTKANPDPPKTGTYNYRRSPNGKGYWVEATADQILYNAFDTKSLWNTPGIRGDIFKGAMFLKNAMVPVQLALSLFHPLHLLLGMDSAAAMTRFTKDMMVSGGNPVKWFGKWLEQMTLGAKGIPLWGIIDNPRVGFRLLKAYQGKLDPTKLSAADRVALQYMSEGGFIPEMSSQFRTNAMENFRKAVRQVAAEYNSGPGGLRRAAGPAAKAGFYTVFAIIDAMQYPMFRLWIPALKIASYLKDVQTALKVDPKLMTDKGRRVLAFRKLAKSVDNRYGEMAYNTLFWNRTLKDIAVANTLSLGWNLGFIREYGGGAMDIGQVIKGKGSLAEKARRGDLDRPLFVMFYTTQVMLYSGLLTWALTGKTPEDLLDYLYPKSGDTDAQGRPERLNTPFYPREFAAIAKHVEHEGVGPGMWHVVSNKASGVIGLVKQWATGVDWRGAEIRDPNSPWHKQVRDTLGATLFDLEPISLQQLRESKKTGKDVALSFSGFGKAPKYVTQTDTEAGISQLYRKYYAPKQTAYETALLSDDRRKLAKLYREEKMDEYGKLLDEMGTKYELTAQEQGKLAVNIMRRGTDYNPYLTMFERLSWQQQKRLLDKMTPEEREIYLPKSNRQHLRYTYEEPAK